MIVSPQEALDVIPQLASIYDEPFADSSQIPTLLISRLARQHVTVALTGDGGDEVFGGYNRYGWGPATWDRLRHVPRALRTPAAAAMTSLAPPTWDRVLSPTGIRMPGDKVHKLAGAMGANDQDDLYDLLQTHWHGDSVVKATGGSAAPIRMPVLEGASFAERMMAADTISYLPDDILTKLDRASMAVALEGRLPFLDHRVVEFAWRLPLPMRVRGQQGKWLLRRLLARYVPTEFFDRPKMGFGVPIHTWLRGPLRPWAEDLLDASRLRREGYFEPAPIRAKWKEHLSGRRNWQYDLWDVLMFQSWLEQQGGSRAGVAPRTPEITATRERDARVRVLWLIKGLGPGGAERLLVEMARFIDRDRFDVEVAYLLPWKDQLVAGLEDQGIEVTCLDVPNPYLMTWIPRLRRFLSSGRFDVVHAHLPLAAIGARFADRTVGIPRPQMVYTEHNMWGQYHPLSKLVNAATFGANDAAIAVSRSVQGSAGPRARRRLQVIPNGVDIEHIREQALSRPEARAELGIPPDALVVGTVGGITPKKGHVFLVEAAALVRQQLPDIRYVFVGLRIETAAIEARAEQLGLGDAITFAGYRPDAPRLVRAFDVFCMPSLFEGMPLSLIEAMSLGVPAVVTDVGGIPEVATTEVDALMVPAKDPEALAGALLRVLTDPDLASRLGAHAADAAEHFRIEEMVRSTEAVYEDLLGALR
jgi:glycosyltransferase involved in cell wall biosynthesis